MPPKILQSWKALLLIQGLGSLMLALGADRNLPVYVLGFALLLPGSVLAAVVPNRWFAWPAIEHFTKSDSFGIQNLLFLPCAVLINAFLFYLVRKALTAYATNRDASQNSQVENSEA